MKRNLSLLALILLVAGCAGIVRNRTITDYREDGTVFRVTNETLARLPSDPDGGAFLTTTTNGISAGISGAQSKADIGRANWTGRNNMLLYAGCSLLILFGGAVMVFGSKLGISAKEANRDGAICIGAGFAGFAALRFVESAEPVMKYVLPVVLVAAVAYFMWRKSKTELNKTLYIPPKNDTNTPS